MKRSNKRMVSIKKYVIVLFSIAVIGIMMLFLSALSVGAKTNEPAAVNMEKYYTSVTISYGDTLWDLADQYMTSEYKDKQEYLSEIMDLNHLESDDIHAGENLVIPYYDVAGK